MPPVPLVRRLTALALAAALGGLAGCQKGAQRAPCPAGEACLEYGANTEPLTLDPQLSSLTDAATIIGDLMMGLTTEGPDGAVVPGMAGAWETSPDGRVWTFHLRKALWSDGAPVTAEDFVFAWRRLLDPATASPNAYLLYVLKNAAAVNAGKAPRESLGVRALDPATLQVTLEHPAPYLPQLAKHQSFFPVPRHVVSRYGDDWVRPGRYVSNGAYRLVSWRLGDRITVEKNPRFFDAGHVCIDRIRYYPTPDAVAAERRIAGGELDVNTSFQSNRLQHLKTALPGYPRTGLWLATVYMSLNTRDVAAFRDLRVRRALSMSVDREFITGRLLRAGQQPAYSFVPPGIANYAPGARVAWAGMPLAARQATARRLLAEAGYTSERPLRLEIKAGATSDGLLLLQAVQADWRAIGVDVAVAQNEGQIALAAFRNRDFQVGLASWTADFNDPVTFLGLLKSDTGGQNYGDYRNPAYDALLAAADQEPAADRRALILRRAEQLMLADEALIPVYFMVSRNLVGPSVTGWTDNIENFHRSRWLCLTGPGRPAQR